MPLGSRLQPTPGESEDRLAIHPMTRHLDLDVDSHWRAKLTCSPNPPLPHSLPGVLAALSENVTSLAMGNGLRHGCRRGPHLFTSRPRGFGRPRALGRLSKGIKDGETYTLLKSCAACSLNSVTTSSHATRAECTRLPSSRGPLAHWRRIANSPLSSPAPIRTVVDLGSQNPAGSKGLLKQHSYFTNSSLPHTSPCAPLRSR